MFYFSLNSSYFSLVGPRYIYHYSSASIYNSCLNFIFFCSLHVKTTVSTPVIFSDITRFYIFWADYQRRRNENVCDTHGTKSKFHQFYHRKRIFPPDVELLGITDVLLFCYKLHRSIYVQNRREGNDQESIQLYNTSHQRHQRERNTNTK